jgi:transcriptional regulator with XRE-family HTH domain
MKSSEAIRALMGADGVSQAELARKMGYKGQSAVGNALARENGMRVDVFIKMAQAMGYEVVVRRGKDEMVVSE